MPVSLLVEGDIVALRPGQEAFASLRGIKVSLCVDTRQVNRSVRHTWAHLRLSVLFQTVSICISHNVKLYHLCDQEMFDLLLRMMSTLFWSRGIYSPHSPFLHPHGPVRREDPRVPSNIVSSEWSGLQYWTQSGRKPAHGRALYDSHANLTRTQIANIALGYLS